MTPFSYLLRMVAAACALTVCACATTPPVAAVTAPPKLEAMLAQANQAAAAGQKEQAIKLWQQTAVAYPADQTPWTSIAQTRYEAGQYGDAIQAAQEILVRDPSNKLANSIIAISGLRLSTRALGDLSRQNNLSGSLRTESQDLAKLLRENLGETILVPGAPAPIAAVRPKPAAKKATTSKSEDTNANPFSTFK